MGEPAFTGGFSVLPINGCNTDTHRKNSCDTVASTIKLTGATERSICKVEEPFETHLKLKLPTSTLERVPLQSNLRLMDKLQSIDNYEFRRILMVRNSIIKTADLLRMSTSNVQQLEREAW